VQQFAWNDFAGAEGSVYRVASDRGEFDFLLEKAIELPASGREGGSFRLEFRGPGEPVLPQSIYRFSRAGESAEIFIVPVARNESGTLYEAIFC
jgi:hypothetical protein